MIKVFLIVGGFTAFVTYVIVGNGAISLMVGGIAGLVTLGLLWLIMDGFDALLDGAFNLLTGRGQK